MYEHNTQPSAHSSSNVVQCVKRKNVEQSVHAYSLISASIDWGIYSHRAPVECGGMVRYTVLLVGEDYTALLWGGGAFAFLLKEFPWD